MLPFKNRLSKRKDHERVQKSGSFVSFDNVAIKALENGTNDTRIGIVVGVKYSKKAVERNLAKRKIQEVVRSEIKNIKKGLDMVIMARKRDEEKTKNINFGENIEEALKKGGLLKNIKEEQSSQK